MCNLYDLGRARRQSRDDWEAAIAAVIKESEEAVAGSTENTGLPQLKQFGIRKTDPGLVLTKEGGHPTAEVMRWGFHRSYNPAVNNARSEKLDHTWSGPWQERRRCLIPVSSFYEWNGPAGAKQTFCFNSTDPEEWLWVAGIWEETPESVEGLPRSYSMLTREAVAPLSEVHHRMPVVLRPEHRAEYLEAGDPKSLLEDSRSDLTFFRCENPLKNPKDHRGPVRETFLPGFDM